MLNHWTLLGVTFSLLNYFPVPKNDHVPVSRFFYRAIVFIPWFEQHGIFFDPSNGTPIYPWPPGGWLTLSSLVALITGAANPFRLLLVRG